jgi:hypothetical protein
VPAPPAGTGGIVKAVERPARLRVTAIRAALLGAALAACSALAGAALVPAAGAASPPLTAQDRALLASPELWATIDVCSPRDQPNTLGVRGSMPGDGNAHDRMFMSFLVQYQGAKSNRWVNLSSDTHAPYVAVGSGASSRQDGTSFQITPVKGARASMLRGVVRFQWRHGSKVVLAISRATSAPHKSLAGADPANFSAAKCSIG